MVHSSSPEARNEHRWLRVTTVLAFLPAFALLLPYGLISFRPLPTVGIAAMFFSAAFSTLVLGRGVRSPGTRACCDMLLAAVIIAILIPRCAHHRILDDARLICLLSWTFLSKDHESWWTARERLIILATYGTTPMILNL